MIDLSYKPRKQAKSWEPEEIACAVIAIAIWAFILIGIMEAL